MKSILIDCGFNTCRVLADFLDNRYKGYEVYGFEAQEGCQKYADRLKESYPDQIKEMFHAAVSTEDGEVEFFEAKKWGPNLKGASTIIKGHAKQMGFDPPIKVKSIDFCRFLSCFDPGDNIVVKMDIEGAEYDILEDLIKRNMLRYISHLIIEFHWHMNERKDYYKKRHDALLAKMSDLGFKIGDKIEEWH